MPTSEMLRRVNLGTDVSNQCLASIIRVTKIGELHSISSQRVSVASYC
jgi:hypothetical protein